MLVDHLYQLLPKSVRDKMRRDFERVRKNKMLDFYSDFIDSQSLVFDIGANIGDYTDIFLELGAKVICLEPQPECIEELRKKYKSDERVTIIGEGVSSKEGKLLLYMDSENHATATFSREFVEEGPFKNRDWKTTVEVETTTLNELIKEYGVPNYCKVDVEGYEYDVIRGLSQPINYISFEYSKKLIKEAEKCLLHLKELGGYEYNYTLGFRCSKFRLGQWVSDPHVLLERIKGDKLWYSGDIYVRKK